MVAYPITSILMDVIRYFLAVTVIPSEAIVARSLIFLLPGNEQALAKAALLLFLPNNFKALEVQRLAKIAKIS